MIPKTTPSPTRFVSLPVFDPSDWLAEPMMIAVARQCGALVGCQFTEEKHRADAMLQLDNVLVVSSNQNR